MAKIDRLGWAEGLAFSAYGLHIGVRANTMTGLAALVPRLPPGWTPASRPVVQFIYSFLEGRSTRPGVRNFHILYAGSARTARTLNLAEIPDAFEAHLQLLVAEFARRRVFIHAGVVGWQGQAIVLPGRSLAGKTTMVAELVRRGCTYYSDEFAVIDGHGRVHPYARPLLMRAQEDHEKPKRCPVEELGGVAGTRPLPVGLVLLTAYRAGMHWRPRRLTPGRAVLETLAHTVPARRDPRAALATLHKVVAGAPVIRGGRGDAGETADRLLSWLAAQRQC